MVAIFYDFNAQLGVPCQKLMKNPPQKSGDSSGNGANGHHALRPICRSSQHFSTAVERSKHIAQQRK
ncbi:hypothetical protein D3C78_1423880 [compost metagenome]